MNADPQYYGVGLLSFNSLCPNWSKRSGVGSLLCPSRIDGATNGYASKLCLNMDLKGAPRYETRLRVLI